MAAYNSEAFVLSRQHIIRIHKFCYGGVWSGHGSAKNCCKNSTKISFRSLKERLDIC